MKTITVAAPIAPRPSVADVEAIASGLFVFGSYCSRVSARLCVVHGVAPVLESLERERRRAELTGRWGRWGNVLRDVRRRAPAKLAAVPPRRRGEVARPFPHPASSAAPGSLQGASARGPRRTL